MRFGIFDHVDDAGTTVARQLEDRCRLIEQADAAGFYAYHVAEHHGTQLGRSPSPNVLLSALAQRTTRLRIGALVYPLPFYEPLRLVEEICMLDQLSGGRLEVGVGKGASPTEGAFYNVSPDTGRDRFDEALDVVLQGLTSPTLTHHGRFYSYDGVPMTMTPVQRPHPPLWFGAGHPDRAAWAAGKGMNIVALLPAAEVRPITDRYRAEWAALGHSATDRPAMGVTRNIVLAPSADEARSIARRAFEAWRRNLNFLHGIGLGRPYPHLPPDFAAWLESGMAYAGTPDGAVDYVADQAERAGIDYMCAQIAFGDIAFAEASRTLGLLATEVIPAVTPVPAHP
jgi:alkanesulfonate monooxygenase SsuD/methylene tetrahydromethanopterin reductase-like flavin-dependent oxidoreductase (luciferase family)